jgi:hypothetical protein
MPRKLNIWCDHCVAWLRTVPPDGQGELCRQLDLYGYTPLWAIEDRTWCHFCLLVSRSVRTWLEDSQGQVDASALIALRACDYGLCGILEGIPASLAIAVAIWNDNWLPDDAKELAAQPSLKHIELRPGGILGWRDPDNRILLELYTTLGTFKNHMISTSTDVYHAEDRKAPFKAIRPGKHYASSAFTDDVVQAVQSWIQYCNNRHRLCLKDVKPLLPTRVIKVGQDGQEPFLHLSADGEIAEYLALSHRWGNTELILKTEKATLSDHVQRIALAALPSTFRDAVLFTRRLGHRYLWIDSLCIVQDDPDDWAREAARMGKIYDNSTVTLSVLQGENSQSGCSWNTAAVRKTSIDLTDRNGEKCTVWCREVQSPTSFQAWTQLEPNTDQDVLLTRGWTMQEGLLAPRLLLFTTKQVIWYCNGLFQEFKNFEASGGMGSINLKNLLAGCLQRDRPFKARSFHKQLFLLVKDRILWRSDSGTPKVGIGAIIGQGAMLNAAAQARLLPMFGRGRSIRTMIHILLWYHMVAMYSKREFTFPLDRLVALSALAKKFAVVVDAEYIAGLWMKEKYIPMQLAWEIEPRFNESAQTTNQEIPCRGSCCALSRQYVAPSWSWASADAEVSMPSSNWWLYARNSSIFTVLEGHCTTLTDPHGIVTDGFLRVRAKTGTIAQTGASITCTNKPEYGMCEYEIMWSSPLAERINAVEYPDRSRFWWFRLDCTDYSTVGLEQRLYVVPLATTDAQYIPNIGIRCKMDRSLLKLKYPKKTHLGLMICIETPSEQPLRKFKRIGVCDVSFQGSVADISWYERLLEEEVIIV